MREPSKPTVDQPKRCRKCLTDFDLATGANVSEKDPSLCVDCDGSAQSKVYEKEYHSDEREERV